MILSKVLATTGLCWLLALPLSFTQKATTPVTKKWAFGLRGGAGFNIGHFENQIVHMRTGQTFIERPYAESNLANNSGLEYYAGGYATRYFSNRWSLRTELTAALNPYNSLAISLGLFPRYRLNNWLSLEAGLETKHIISGYERNDSKMWLGAAAIWKNMEFNLRYSPGYTPASPLGKGGLHHAIQMGMSFKL